MYVTKIHMKVTEITCMCLLGKAGLSGLFNSPSDSPRLNFHNHDTFKGCTTLFFPIHFRVICEQTNGHTVNIGG